MADSTRAMRHHIIERDILSAFRNRLLAEITPDDLRALCMKVKNRGAPATAILVALKTCAVPAQPCSMKHEGGRSSRGVYNKAEYAEQRRPMLQEWANMIDVWVDGDSYIPTLMPATISVPVLRASV